MMVSTSTLKFCRAALVIAVGYLATMGVASAQQPSPASVDLARQVILVKGGNSMFDPVIPGVIESAKNAFLPTNPNLSKDLTEVANQLKKEYDAPKRAELLNEVAKIYAQRFTEQELKDLLTFYKSPLGQKVVVEEPKALDAALQRAQDWANNFSEEVITKMRAEMKKRGANL
jgi:uncharacterized protein